MSEIRKQLTELQFRLLVDAQLGQDRAQAALEAAAKRADELRALVYETCGVLGMPVQRISIDAGTRELVIALPDPPVASDPVEGDAPAPVAG